MRWIGLVLLWVLAAAWAVWWVRHNPLPDGYQNEYLHIGNAFDLWGSWLRADLWHLRHYSETSYWPPGFYVAAFPLLYVERMLYETQSRLTLVLSNLGHLAVLLWGMERLGRALGGRLAPWLLVLCPGVFGSLVRYEPNLAVIAWTAAGLAFLVHSDGLSARRASLGWALCLAIGLMMDRLSVAFFLAPAAIPLLWRGRRERAVWVNLGLSVALVLLICGPWYYAFFVHNAEEIFSQAPVGEIDSAGELTSTPGRFAPVWYLLALVDSQAGPVLGVLLLAGVAAAFRGPLRREKSAVLWSAAVGVLFFTLIAKKQVYYTLPALPALAALASTWGRPAWVGLAGGAWSFLALGLGWLPGGPWLPEAMVAPRHVLARPPIDGRWPIDQAVALLGPEPRFVSVLSEDEGLYEGFLVLEVRQRWMWASVRGVTLDPQGTWEWFRYTDSVVWVGPTGALWPSDEAIERQLRDDHYDLDALPPVGRFVASLGPGFQEIGRWRMEQMDVVAFRRR